MNRDALNCTQNSIRPGFAYGWSLHMRQCATSGAPKDGRKASATSAAGSGWRMSSMSARRKLGMQGVATDREVG